MVIMKAYTDASFEISMGDQLYSYNKDESLDSNGFHFGKFLGYIGYVALKALGLEIKSKAMKRYEDCR